MVIFDENVGPKDYAERGNYVVPYRLAYKPDGHEATTYVEHEIGSQKEHQTSVSNSVGLSVGAKEVGKVGVKVGWSNTQGKSDDSTQMASYGVARVNKYALVLDPPNMELNARLQARWTPRSPSLDKAYSSFVTACETSAAKRNEATKREQALIDLRATNEAKSKFALQSAGDDAAAERYIIRSSRPSASAGGQESRRRVLF